MGTEERRSILAQRADPDRRETLLHRGSHVARARPRHVVHTVRKYVDNYELTSVQKTAQPRPLCRVSSHVSRSCTGRSAFTQVRDLSAMGRDRASLQAVHSALWITVWMELCTDVETVVDDDVHNDVVPRRSVAS